MGADDEERVPLPLAQDFQPTATTSSSYCRICHEEEDLESGTKLESPCGCSGTAKYAHRDCIQRWCNMKGNTTCEICLQKYEPNYIAPPKKENAQIIEVVTIRGNFEIPDDEEDDHNLLLETDGGGDDISEYVSAAERSASFCRTVAVMLTALLLARQLLAVLALDEQDYPFSLLTVFVVRVCGVVAPMYMIIHSLTVIQNSIRRQQLQQRIRRLRMANRREGQQQQRRQQLHVRVDIQTL